MSAPRSTSFTLRVGICAAGLWLLVTSAGAQTQSAKVQQMADFVVSAYNDRNYEVIFRQFNTVARAQVTAEELRRLYDGLHASAGNITALGKPAFFDAIGIFPATFEHAAKELLIALDDAGRSATW